MGRYRIGHLRLLALVAITMLPGISLASAQGARPHGPSGDAAGWRVADMRELDIDGEPLSLSPDGQWIAGLGPDREFCVWDIDDLDPACSDDSYAIAPESIAWSPDSTAVAFSLDFARLFHDSDILVFTIDEGTVTNLTDDGIEKVSLETPRTEGGPVLIDLMPTWSPDGRELTFARSDWSAETLTTTLMTIPAEGGEPAKLLTLDADGPAQVFTPMRWLADGSLLYTIWSPSRDEPASGLWRYDPGKEPVQLVTGSESDGYPGAVATDVYDDNGQTIVLGYSPLLAAQYAPDPDHSLGFALDLETGTIEPLEEAVGIDNSAVTMADKTRIIAPPRVSPDGSAMVLAISYPGSPGTLAIASTGATSEAPGPIDVEPRYSYSWAFQGFGWASNNTILAPTVEEPAVLLTLDRAAEAGPAVPCSCTPPPRG